MYRGERRGTAMPALLTACVCLYVHAAAGLGRYPGPCRVYAFLCCVRMSSCKPRDRRTATETVQVLRRPTNASEQAKEMHQQGRKDGLALARENEGVPFH